MQVLFIIMMMLISGVSSSSEYKYYSAEGPSMSPTIVSKDRLTVDSTYYNEHIIERGDIIVFTDSINGSDFVKRVVGLSEDTVKITDNKLYVNGVIQEEKYTQSEITMTNQDSPETTVPVNSVFVLGDNRSDSLDSRIIGSINIDNILGKVIKVRHP